MRLRARLFVVLIISLGCVVEKIVYVETDPEAGGAEPEIIETRMRANVVRWSVTHKDGIPYLTATGRVTNSGPKAVHSVRVWIGSNHGMVRISQSIPSSLGVNDSGTWQVSNLVGTYVQYKNVTFEVRK